MVLERDWGEAGVLWQLVKEHAGLGDVWGCVMGAAWRHASMPPPPGLVTLSCQMKSCN